MKCTLIARGSTGDTQPFLALARRLRDEGIAVNACTARGAEGQFRALGVDYHCLGESWCSGSTAALHPITEKVMRTWNPLQSARIIIREGYLPEIRGWYEGCLAALPGADLLICHGVDFAAQAAAETLGIPALTATTIPINIPTREMSPLPGLSFGGIGNRLAWAATRWLFRLGADPLMHRCMAAIGARRRRDYLFDGMGSRECHLIACSRHVWPPHGDLPAHMHVTGAWFYDEPDTPVPEALRRFVESGAAPAVFTFGSMGDRQPAETAALFVQAASQAGLRAVIQSGYAGFRVANPPPNVYVADYVPHAWLFTRAAAVVHHAGIGTCHAACAAGVPSVPVPYHGDQPLNARRLSALGVAPGILPRRKLTAPALAALLRQTQTSPAFRAAAQALRGGIAAERGLDEAMRHIREFAAARGIR